MVRVKVSSKHQIAVPAEVRRRLGIQSGDYLRVNVCDGALVLTPEPHSYTGYLRGLHREVWADIDPDEYLHRERDAWSN
ncbi:MAG TPA: AbrB/MazE/SpoVT family DNA-binding domain-containing protein [Thermomicrobiaceae bacterium]|nr:AbrB/MazE/SpoVT family DNA-binding domain-containing protein [Thermomicrobiaceae bacterium]